MVEEGSAPAVTASPLVGIRGSGRWLVVEYEPTALFSLKISLATSSVGKTLVVPSPYAIKMAFVDAAFRAGLTDGECAEFLRSLVSVDVRVAPPAAAVVTHTFVKVRQEPHGGSRPAEPYISSIAYRELVHHQGRWRWAFDVAAGGGVLTDRLSRIAAHVSYVGKRGSFVQFVGLGWRSELDAHFTQVPAGVEVWQLPGRAHVVPLDDFGPEAMEILSSYSQKPARRDRHRRFVHTVVPMGMTNTGPGFTEYRAE